MTAPPTFRFCLDCRTYSWWQYQFQIGHSRCLRCGGDRSARKASLDWDGTIKPISDGFGDLLGRLPCTPPPRNPPPGRCTYCGVHVVYWQRHERHCQKKAIADADACLSRLEAC